MVPGRLVGRSILITGAASGIGRATACRAATEGAVVGVIDVDDAGLASLAGEVRSNGGQARVERADVTDSAALGNAVQALGTAMGGLDGVFANAGILSPPQPIAELDPAEWQRILDVNLTGAIMTLKAALPFVRPGGSLLVSGSSLAIRPREGRLAYVAAKAGLHAAARALALELSPRRIRVNVIAPGLTDTPMVRAVPGHVETGLLSVPLGELVDPEEVAGLAVLLLGADLPHVTGSIFTVDGGRTAG